MISSGSICKGIGKLLHIKLCYTADAELSHSFPDQTDCGIFFLLRRRIAHCPLFIIGIVASFSQLVQSHGNPVSHRKLCIRFIKSQIMLFNDSVGGLCQSERQAETHNKKRDPFYFKFFISICSIKQTDHRCDQSDHNRRTYFITKVKNNPRRKCSCNGIPLLYGRFKNSIYKINAPDCKCHGNSIGIIKRQPDIA